MAATAIPGILHAADETVLDEVVVTAERREASVQDIPIAMTAIRGDDLDDKAVRRLDDLQFAVPGLTITNAGVTQAVNIRGVGLASGSPAVTNGVSTYIDGLFQPPVVTTNSFYDIADVEVMRGPQGTFVGSSSTGGAVFINSRNPTLDGVNGFAQAELGNYARKALQGAINLPVNSTLALRLAVNYADRKSYYTDRGTVASDAGKLDEASARLGVLWKPSGSFQALLKNEYSHKETGGFPMRPVLSTTYAAGRVGGIRDLSYDMGTRNTEYQWLNSLELRYITPGGIVLRSLSGYQDKKVHNITDIDSSTLTAAPATISRRQIQDVRERVLTEEINVISPTEGALDWVVGGYFQQNKIDVVNLNFNNNPAFPQRILVPTTKRITGFFGQLAYQATDALEVTLGARNSRFRGEQTTGSGVYNNFGSPTGTRVNTEGSHEDTQTTGKLSANWKLNADNLLFAFVARGYKPGGFNSLTSQFDPETVTDTEIGWKTTALDGHLRASVNAFNYNYQNFQAQVIDTSSGTNVVKNVAGARVRGAELELQARFGGWGLTVAWPTSIHRWKPDLREYPLVGYDGPPAAVHCWPDDGLHQLHAVPGDQQRRCDPVFTETDLQRWRGVSVISPMAPR